MRIHLNINAAGKELPFNHQPLLTGTIHKWLGWNNEHGEVSLYSFSWLTGGKKTSKGIHFEKEASFFFSSYDPDLIKTLIYGIQKDPKMFYDLSVSEVVIEENPDLTDREHFLVASPVFIKRKDGNHIKHVLFDDQNAGTYLKETLQTRMKKAGIYDNDFSISFDKNYTKAGTKKVKYNEVDNRASWCPVIIKGKPETKLFAWNVGLGNSTGIGFGSLK